MWFWYWVYIFIMEENVMITLDCMVNFFGFDFIFKLRKDYNLIFYVFDLFEKEFYFFCIY